MPSIIRASSQNPQSKGMMLGPHLARAFPSYGNQPFFDKKRPFHKKVAGFAVR